MNRVKIKIKKKKTGHKLVVKIPAEYVINKNQNEVLENKINFGVLKIKEVKKNKLEFAEIQGISLYERLQEPISENDFFFIIEQLIIFIQSIEKIGLVTSNIVLDIRYIFFNKTTKEISFVYLPIASPHKSKKMLKFLDEMINSATPNENNSNYLSKFNYYLKKLNTFDCEEIQSYIYRINSNIVMSLINDISANSSTTNKKGFKNNEFGVFVQQNQISQEPYDDEKTDIMTEEDLSESKKLCDKRNDMQISPTYKSDDTYLLDDESTELYEEDENTDLYVEDGKDSQHTPILIRTLTDEVIRINKSVFRIGKEENCVDYIVSNNIAISRSHADIIIRNGRFFVFDLRSKNKTYINNRVLPAEQEVEIFNGDILKLANEEFIFQA